MPRYKDRRRAQSGATLVELLVSMVIMGLALTLVVGTLSSGLLDASVAKRNTAVQAVAQYELDKIGGSTFSPSAQPYSECFATENSTPPQATGFRGACASSFSLRADVTVTPGGPTTTTGQTWTVTVVQMPGGSQVGNTTSLYKANL